MDTVFPMLYVASYNNELCKAITHTKYYQEYIILCILGIIKLSFDHFLEFNIDCTKRHQMTIK